MVRAIDIALGIVALVLLVLIAIALIGAVTSWITVVTSNDFRTVVTAFLKMVAWSLLLWLLFRVSDALTEVPSGETR